MRVVGVRVEELFIGFEVTPEQIERILAFYIKARPLYDKVFKDEDITIGDYMENEFIAKLKSMLEDIEKGGTNGA